MHDIHESRNNENNIDREEKRTKSAPEDVFVGPGDFSSRPANEGGIVDQAILAECSISHRLARQAIGRGAGGRHKRLCRRVTHVHDTQSRLRLGRVKLTSKETASGKLKAVQYLKFRST